MIMRKLIYLLLDTLLIIGALAGIATINRGKWISTVLVFYQPVEIGSPNRSFEPETQGTARISAVESNNRTASDCLLSPMPMIPDWYDVNLTLIKSNHCGDVQDMPEN